MNFVKKLYRNKNKILVLLLILTIKAIFYNESLLKKIEISNKLTHTEESIQDLLSYFYPNQTVAQATNCRIPKLELIGHEKYEPYKSCKQRAEWGYLKSNHWNLNQTVVKVLKQLSCQYRTVYRSDDFNLVYSKMMNLVDQQLIEDDVIEVVCKGKFFNRQMVFNHLYAQIVPKINGQVNYNELNKNKICTKPLNIILLSYDSLSRVSWFKRLPKTTKYMIKEMKFSILHGQSILGDGTPACMIPLLTGKTEEELPSALKSDPDGKYADQVYPFIWNELHTRGYMSFHMEDWPHVTTFHYRMRGLSNKTAHHYMRAYQMNLWNRVSRNYYSKKDDLCIGSVKRHKKSLDLLSEFIESYNGYSRNHIGIMHFIENSHDGNERANHLDEDLYNFLKENHKNSNFKNTAVFLFSDHGVRFGNDRNSQQGFLEERLPFFSVYLPPEYKQANPEKYNNLLRNSEQLTTAFDIHETLRELTCIEPKPSLRSISILNHIPVTRKCDEMGISLHYCVCQQVWTFLEEDSLIAKEASKFIVDYINNDILVLRENFCVKLLLKTVGKIQKATINENEYLKLNFETSPNNASYEGLLKWSVDEHGKNHFNLDSPNYLSRNNAYKNQADCLANAPKDNKIHEDLRKFCFCKLK